MLYNLLLVKRVIEDICMFPFILWGRLLAKLKPLNKTYDIFFIMPFYHVGGAEKVHGEIIQQFPGKRIKLYFTKHSHNEALLHLFKAPNIDIEIIAKYSDNKLLYFLSFIYRGKISGYINAQCTPTVVFNGQSNFGYKLSPWVKKSVPQIELIHSLCNFSYIRLPFIQFYKRSVTVSKAERQKHIDIYRRYNVPAHFDDRFIYIDLAINLPLVRPVKQVHKPLTVLYVGRATAEKRPAIVAEIAAAVHEKAPDVRFQFMGDVTGAISATLLPHCELLGNIGHADKIAEIYSQADIIVIPSATESGPLVFMEGMAYGLAVLATPVGMMPEHFSQVHFGELFSSVSHVATIVAEAKQYILHYNEDPSLLQSIGNQNIQYAFQHFGMERLHQAYQNLVNNITEVS
ncbi:glycosyltransferase involved in cell wall biosynthesis [Chitinophaga skermanii]|uniref:Glycosyltransferase involved in cell wall biosynthesis n=1 Tax=Chitinophaga skermanii TaxID=331697 RepID=A0A327QWR5_9BACT|nr:glycosyltransferase family 4 protein [Chitinophaga skermanii]RAJ08395.1 glycosyltransferase involved in cell wall biosynthesis [Chitinophaga skermanii]